MATDHEKARKRVYYYLASVPGVPCSLRDIITETQYSYKTVLSAVRAMAKSGDKRPETRPLTGMIFPGAILSPPPPGRKTKTNYHQRDSDPTHLSGELFVDGTRKEDID